MKKILTFLTLLTLTFQLQASENYVDKENLDYGNVRYTVTTNTSSDFSEKDQEHLREFIANKEAFAGILCTNENFAMVKTYLSETDPELTLYEKSYDGHPWILTKIAFDRLPNLDQNNRVNGALSVVTIEPTKGDVRSVVLKDNKRYVMNCAGTFEPEDESENKDQLFKNIAKRELHEELDLSVEDSQLTKMGHFNFKGKAALLGLEYLNHTEVFSCHLNPDETSKWANSHGFNINDDEVIAYQQVSGEIDWIYVLKPSIFSQEQIMLPMADGKEAPLNGHHAAMPAVILKGMFGDKDVLVDRGVTYLNGCVEYNDIRANFGK